MRYTPKTRTFLLLIIIALNIGCDQMTKAIARKHLIPGETVSVVGDIFILTKVENTGAFLSAGNNLPDALRFILLTLLPIVVLAYGLFYLFYKVNLPRMMQIGLCFLLGGGIGNIFDRVKFGSVTDFMHLDFGIVRTGVFNFADLSIMIGISMLFILSFKKKVVRKPIES